jgi:hypothetical protein
MSTRDIYPVLITRDVAATIERCRRFANVRVETGAFFKSENRELPR